MTVQISAALEFSVDKLPSLVWEHESGAGLYLGGFKAAVNLDFLRKSRTGLVINTARGLETTLGPKYKQLVCSLNR